ncbi:Sugar phosphate isomerase/epimerase [Paenibacillus uliginis N3/975]|uniref:Sugar phosphate isomerase/epimerase n=1 Tax=Paenibacillus uliginis N3/975 TaxID=1313296 RepID=A0A1X7HJK3_9BACL|nr:sugar phosphate isomerase/epimerase family protein [Paenibacillus uliginis]SMF87732.1 Sugar phosphate isomerase/epimerase [Paenibacillus uliginis N3/975]
MLNVGLQLYTLRDQLENDFEGTIREVARLGYQGVEFHHFYGRTAEQVKALLDETGLEVIGTHVPYIRLQEALEEELAFHQAIGNQYIIVPWLADEDRGNLESLVNHIRIFSEAAQNKGISIAYHNHDFEFDKMEDGRPFLYALYDEVPASLLQVELDTCWVHYAGYVPSEVIAKYAGRTPLVHLKDLRRQEDGSPMTVELGEGEVDLAAVVKASDEAGVQWIIVEQDFCKNPPMDSIAKSMEWLKKHALEGGNVRV